jgi:hypothetical protein
VSGADPQRWIPFIGLVSYVMEDLRKRKEGTLVLGLHGHGLAKSELGGPEFCLSFCQFASIDREDSPLSSVLFNGCLIPSSKRCPRAIGVLVGS